MNHVGRASVQNLIHLCSYLLASVGGITVCPETPLQPPPPPGGGDRHLATVSPPTRGETVVPYRGGFQGGGGGRVRKCS